MASNTNTTDNHKLHYWIILIILSIFSLIAGFIGFQSYFAHHGEEFNLSRSIYRTFQLFTFSGGDLTEPIPWTLHLARFSAPLTTIMAFVMALLGIFRDQWKRIKIAMMNKHVVIIGFGNKGKNVMEESLRKNEKVLVIDNDPYNANLASVKPPKSMLLLGNANNDNTLKKARITKAKSVYLLIGDDTIQVNTCLLIYQLVKESKRDENNPLSCIMHLQKLEFLKTMKNQTVFNDILKELNLKIFNVYENSARELFEDNPPDLSGITSTGSNYVQIIIFGFGKSGEALALQTAFTGHYINDKKPKVFIIDRLAQEKVPDFLQRYPTFKDYCDIRYLAIEANSPQLTRHLVKSLEDPLALNTIVLCFDNKILNILLGLQIANIELGNPIITPKVFVRTNDNDSLTSFSQYIKPYGLTSKVCSREVIIDGLLDKKARAIHDLYLKKREKETDFGSSEADVSWEELPQEYKDSNRKSADHIGVKIRGIGCDVVDISDKHPAATFSQDEIEKLSELEHRRWMAERSLAGWTYGKPKNAKTRTSPYLVEWNQLPENIKDYDREIVINIPMVLKEVGLKIVRKEKN